MYRVLRTTLAAVALALPLAAFAETGQPEPLFAGQDPLEVRLVVPLTTLLRERSDEEELAGTFSWREAGKAEQSASVAVRTRGNFRRQRSTCPFPPLRLNFRKSEVAGTLLDGQDKVKLVTHCRTGSRHYEETLLKEYLAYRMLNMLTDISFRVRLLEITYQDSEDDGDTTRAYGFLIEGDEQFAARTGLEILGIPSTRVSLLNGEYTNLVSMFQYMIANTDFSPVAGPEGKDCCHNVELFEDSEGRHLPVPYDFDMSGLVDAKYAAPNPRLRIRNVKQRLYRGRCENNAHVEDTVALFVARKAAIYDVVAATPGLGEGAKREVSRFIDDFYAAIGDPHRRDRDILSECL